METKEQIKREIKFYENKKKKQGRLNYFQEQDLIQARRKLKLIK